MINLNKLKEIVAATAAGTVVYVSAVDGKPMLDHSPQLIEVNKEMQDGNGNIAARATAAASEYLSKQAENAAGASASVGQLLSGFVAPPPKKRGNSAGTVGTSKYPFDQLELNGSFYVGNSEVEKGDAFKTLSATVSSANRRYSEPTGESEVVKRAKRGDDRKAILDSEGKKIYEEVTVEKRKQNKHFKIVAVEGGKAYGNWTAPETGAVIIRDL